MDVNNVFKWAIRFFAIGMSTGTLVGLISGNLPLAGVCYWGAAFGFIFWNGASYE